MSAITVVTSTFHDHRSRGLSKYAVSLVVTFETMTIAANYFRIVGQI